MVDNAALVRDIQRELATHFGWHELYTETTPLLRKVDLSDGLEFVRGFGKAAICSLMLWSAMLLALS